MRIGIEFAVDNRTLSPLESLHETGTTLWTVTKGTFTAIGGLFKSEKRSEVTGIVGAYEVTRQNFEFDLASALFSLGLLSFALALFNLFPFLPLDGGHVFWALAEKVRRRPIPYEVMEKAGFVGFVLVVFLGLYVLSHDVHRLLNGGFHVR